MLFWPSLAFIKDRSGTLRLLIFSSKERLFSKGILKKGQGDYCNRGNAQIIDHKHLQKIFISHEVKEY